MKNKWFVLIFHYCCPGDGTKTAKACFFPSHTQFTSEGCACVLQLCGQISLKLSSQTGSEVMTSPLQPLDFLSQQQRVFPSAGNLCSVSLLMWKHPTQERADESYSVGLEIPLCTYTHIWELTILHTQSSVLRFLSVETMPMETVSMETTFITGFK